MANTAEGEFVDPAGGQALPTGEQSAVPWQIWIVVVLLALEGVGNFFSMFDNPIAAWWLFAKCVFITGLIKGWQWVFWIFLAVGAIHVVGFLEIMPIASALNLLMMALTFSARRYFFDR